MTITVRTTETGNTTTTIREVKTTPRNLISTIKFMDARLGELEKLYGDSAHTLDSLYVDEHLIPISTFVEVMTQTNPYFKKMYAQFITVPELTPTQKAANLIKELQLS